MNLDLSLGQNNYFKDGHAFLSPSSPAWMNDSPEKFETRWNKQYAKERGTALHLAANILIKYGYDKTFFQYVNECRAFGMTPEHPLYLSKNCGGTADAIAFDIDKKILRISDLKTGESGSFKQLLGYAGLFTYQYGQFHGFGPKDIKKTELRLYKPNEVSLYEPTTDELIEVINTMVEKDNWCEEMKQGGKLLCNSILY